MSDLLRKLLSGEITKSQYVDQFKKFNSMMSRRDRNDTEEALLSAGIQPSKEQSRDRLEI